jgi:hypothetical protein
MSLSHAIVFIPVILALVLAAALVSLAFMESAISHSGTYNSGGIMQPAVTGYVASIDWQELQKNVSGEPESTGG